MTPEFATLVNPTIHRVLSLVDRIKQGDQVDLPAQRMQIRRELEDAEMTASSSSSIRTEDFRLAKQGLVFWIDEVLTVVDRKWISDTLEWEFYESNDRAWKFYVEGEQKARRSTADVAELWYLLLVLGFEGDIQNAFYEHMNNPFPAEMSPEEARRRWAVQLAQQTRQQRIPELPRPSLEGDVRPLSGARTLRTALLWFSVLSAVLVVLLSLRFFS